MPLAPMKWLEGRSYERLARRIMAEGGLESSVFQALKKIGIARRPFTADEPDASHLLFVLMTEAQMQDKDPPIVELTTSRRAMAFQMAGRQVFHFDAPLVEELMHTDVGDVLTEELQVPYDAFYLTFDGLDGIAGMAGIQGVYVARSDDRQIEVSFMGIADDGRPFEAGSWSIDLAPGDDVDTAIARTAAGHRERTADMPRIIAEISAQAVGNSRVDVSGEMQEAIRSYEHGSTMLDACLPLVVNALLYIDVVGTQGRGWNPQAPAELTAKADSRGAGARKAEQKLVQLGWTRTKLCRLEEDARSGDADPVDGRSVRPHWRRGHWRRQRHGAGRTLMRRIRVRPTRVTGSSGLPMAEGRTYEVEPSTAS